MATLMWEVRAAPGAIEGVLAFAQRHAHASASIYRSADDRVVVIDPTGHGLPDVPAALVTRPPHEWRFEPVERA